MRLLLSTLLALPFLTACLGSNPGEVAVLVADASSNTAALDADAFSEALAEQCEGCTVTVYDAEGDVDAQREQFQTALDRGVGAVVVEAVEAEVAEEFADADTATPLVAAGTFVPGADWFVGVTAAVEASEYGTDLEAAQALLAGDETSFQHVPTAAISADAAMVVTRVMAREDLTAPTTYEGVPSWIHEPVDVTLSNLTTALVAPGLLSIEDLCEGAEARCAKLGIA